ncbi:hypothetical protein [Halorussus salinus]|uniref:hypothetical protein n=1 Tax=Halorussus salinus TaxID=1364935 RepID=UPI001092C334|nr:hypothetical protein [Halorussus salinus]
MNDTTTLIALLTALLLVAGGVGLGATGSPTAGTADSVRQETTTNQTTMDEATTMDEETTMQETTRTAAGTNETTTVPAEARSGATDDETTAATGGETTAADNETTTAGNATQTTAQAGGQPGATNVTARNVTIDRLVLRNVTLLDASVGDLTVESESAENVTNQTYSDVSVQRIEAAGNVTDLTLTNVSINDEELATALVGESGRLRIETRTVMGEAVLQNQTVEGLEVGSATVRAGAAENVSVNADAATANQSESGTQTEGQPAISAESAVVGGADLASLNVSGVSTGETAGATETTAQATQTTVQATETTTQSTQTTAQATQTTAEGNETTTVPAEARSGATDDETTTTESGGA